MEVLCYVVPVWLILKNCEPTQHTTKRMVTNRFIYLQAYSGRIGPSSKHVSHEDNNATISFPFVHSSFSIYDELENCFKNKNPSPHPINLLTS